MIVEQYSSWMDPTLSSFQTSSSWVNGLSELMHRGDQDGILSSAISTLGILLKNQQSSSLPAKYSQIYGSALNLLRNGLMNAYNVCRTKLLAASMCLILAEVRIILIEVDFIYFWLTPHFAGDGSKLQRWDVRSS